MPIHDWTRVEAGTYHNFHQGWAIEIRNALNGGVLPTGYMALIDQRVLGFEPDIVAIQEEATSLPGGIAVALSPPQVRQSAYVETDRAVYARKANRIAVRDSRGETVAMIELVSPGNKDGERDIDAFVEKVAEFLRKRIHVLVVDLFPPTPLDPAGIHRLIWSELGAGPFPKRPAGKPLTLAGYDAGPPLSAYVEPLAVGDEFPLMPLFLRPGWYVNVPLEQTYQESWRVLPASIRRDLEPTA